MIFIAHRGNINGPSERENSPAYLLEAIKEGYYVETDLWIISYSDEEKLYLGHDNPQYEIQVAFLLDIKDKLFCHCKNIHALQFIINYHPEIECFFHDVEEYVLTSKNKIWTNVGNELTEKSICVMPERVDQIPEKCLGVCTDFPYKYEKFLN